MRAKTIAVIIVAAGRGERVSVDGATEPKQYRLLAGKPVLTRTIQSFLDYPGISPTSCRLSTPTMPSAMRLWHWTIARLMPPVMGGASRQASVLAGLKALAPHRPDLVLIQDARPPLCRHRDLIGDVIAVLARRMTAPCPPLRSPIPSSGRSMAKSLSRHRRSQPALRRPDAAGLPLSARFSRPICGPRAIRASSPMMRKSPNGRG